MTSISLMSNNPEKFRDLEARGVRITDRIPLVAVANAHNRAYLETKRARSGHLLPAGAPTVRLPLANPLG